MSETREKLHHLLPHWVEHNAAHLDGYRQWAERARAAGLGQAAAALEEAIRDGGAVDAALRRALAALEPETK